MIEIIDRTTEAEKKTIGDAYSSIQISINSWGHLVIRVFNDALYRNVGEKKEKDQLIVFNRKATDVIISYLRNIIEIGDTLRR
ncbi:MAG: hypothetical protein ACTSVA_00955 [Candidatus Njordarchaeales archaeon]